MTAAPPLHTAVAAADLLRQVRALLYREGPLAAGVAAVTLHWSRRGLAVGDDGFEALPWEPRATRWSLLGALLAVSHRQAVSRSTYTAALMALMGAYFALGPRHRSLEEWEADPDTQIDAVLAVIDRAIERAARRAAA